jgi:hypothetical protein
MTHSYQPVACSLSTDEGAVQLLDWANLRGHVVTTDRIEHGVAMTFGADLVESVEDLAAREAECCSFLSIATIRSDDSIRLEITSHNPDAGAVIDMLVGASS